MSTTKAVKVLAPYVVGCAASLIAGICVGLKHQDKEITDKIIYLHYLMNELKEKNNKLVNNIATVYTMSDADKSKLSDTDIMLMDMWMD